MERFRSVIAPALGLARRLPGSGAPAGRQRYDRLFAEHEQERHRRILDGGPPTVPAPPPGYRAETSSAATLTACPSTRSPGMGTSEEQVLALLRAGKLEVHAVHGELHVRPAILSVVAIRTRTVPSA